MYVKLAARFLPCVLLPVLMSGCGGGENEDSDAVRAPQVGLYQGTAFVTYPTFTEREFSCAAYIAPDGRARLFGIHLGESETYDLLSYSVVAGGAESRESQVEVNGLTGTGDGTALGTSPLRLSLRGKRFSFDADLSKRSFPQIGTTFNFREGTYRGRILFPQSDGSLAGFGTATATLTGKTLVGETRYSGLENTLGSGGQFGIELEADGTSSAQAVVFGGVLSNDTVRYSATQSAITLRIRSLSSEDTLAWIELDRQ